MINRCRMFSSLQNVTKKFHVGDLLSVTTGYVLSPQGIRGVYNFIGYLTEKNTFLDNYGPPYNPEIFKEHVLFQYPLFEKLDASCLNEHNELAWLDIQKKIYGEYLPVYQIRNNAHKHNNPFTDTFKFKAMLDCKNDESTGFEFRPY